jgi:glycosyltransferase involved in cell wall biosynthesis
MIEKRNNLINNLLVIELSEPEPSISMSTPLLIDLRCLQDPNYAERGIGNHARSIIASAPSPFTAIIDPHLPALSKSVAALAAHTVPHAYIPDIPPGATFLNPSPMSPDQNFIAPILRNPGITKIACVYDFIPFDDQKTYLAHSISRLEYFAAMALLRRYQLFLTISEDTDTRLRALYGDVHSHVTGVALPPWIRNLTPEAPRHILMVGGDDARKNPEILLRAHAASESLRSIPLVIAGSCATAIQNQTITDVELPGRLPDAGMRRLYAQALCVVIPSRAEGFSLPVIEAMAAGTPAIVSDIPAHRALVPDPAARFAPDDAERLTRILEDIARHPARREAMIAAQSHMWRGFTEGAVGERVWDAIQGQGEARTSFCEQKEAKKLFLAGTVQ